VPPVAILSLVLTQRHSTRSLDICALITIGDRSVVGDLIPTAQSATNVPQRGEVGLAPVHGFEELNGEPPNHAIAPAELALP
jgi:hypothetical protein